MEEMSLIERRKYPRYCCRLVAYLNEKQVHLYLCDLSLGGCFVETEKEHLLPRGSRVNLVLFLPCIGPIPVEGVVQHHGTEKRVGMGIEFVRFSDRLHLVYAKFVKILSILEEARALYQELVSQK
jgi:hypothetical protein